MTEILDAGEADDLLRVAQRFIEARAGAFHPDKIVGTEARHALWPAIAELGLPYLLSSEHGGLTLGNGPVLSAVFKLIGTNLLPDYLIEALAITPVLVAASGPDAEAAVGPIRDGSRYVASALLAEKADAAVAADPFAGMVYSDGGLSGMKILVRDADFADGFLVGARGADGTPVILFVEAGAAGLSLNPQDSLDPLSAPSRLTLDKTPAVVIAQGEAAVSVATLAANVAKLMVVSEIAGVADAVTAAAVDYVKVRTQFGRAIGSYQSVKHMIADLWRESYQADCVRQEMAASIARGGDAEDVVMACGMGKAWAGPFIRRTVESALQLFGGIGFTAEGPLALHYLRALTLTNSEGASRDLVRWIGRRALETAQ